MRTLLTICFLTTAASASAQVFSSATLTGKYFVRHVQFTTDNAPTDERSIWGTMTFDGRGAYSFAGTQTVGTNFPAVFDTSGGYSVKPGGEVSLSNPQTPSLTINARYGVEAIIGASTEATANTFDIFVAIPAPTGAPTNATLSVSYNFIDFELVPPPNLQIRSAGGQLQFDGVSTAQVVSGQGHSTNVNGGAPFQQSPKGTYAVNSDGTGTLTLPAAFGVSANVALFGTSARSLAISQSGNIVLAGTPGGHDILIGLRDAASDSIALPGAFAGRYWLSSFEVDATGQAKTSVDVGSATVISADSAVITTQRQHQSQNPTNFYITGSSAYATATNGGSLTTGNSVLFPGRGGPFVVADLGGTTSQPDPTTYSFGILLPIPNVSGTGVFLNPQGVVNAASNAPAGDPIAPGEFLALYGTGLSTQTVVTAPPYPMSAGNVSVTIGGLPAPVYLASPSQITCLVPFGLSLTSGTADIIVTNGNVTNGNNTSNIVTVPTLPTSPGIFSADLSGQGDGIIVHLNGNLVNAKNPAVGGETLVMYLTGLGVLQNAVKDGAPANAADPVLATTSIQVNGIAVTNISYAGINPSFPGLYQINFQLPTVPGHGEVPLVLIASGTTGTTETSLFVQ